MTELEAGNVFGKCVLLERMAAGGAGQVWKARQRPPLDRHVAIKFLSPKLAGDEELVSRFEREASVLARLNHPNIVTIHAFEREADRVFLVMELVEGRTLDKLIPSGGMKLDPFFGLALQITEAVAAAHGEEIVHRDLKPYNIMVLPGSVVKILDFGLAKLRRDPDSSVTATSRPEREIPPGEESNDLTREGRILGTWRYMSPEQARGLSVDTRSDVFSLGLIFYQMLTGKRPFAGKHGAEIVQALTREKPPTLERADLPGALVDLVGRCLARDPARRFPSARELTRELAAIRHLRREYRPNREAMEAYEKALVAWNRRYDQRIKEALGCCEAALAADPKFAAAHALKTNCYNILCLYGLTHPALVRPVADLHSAEGLRLDPEIPETWTARGMYRLLFEWDVEGAEHDLRRACGLGRFALAHWWLALLLAWDRRMPEAIREVHTAVQWEASSPIMQCNAGMVHYYAGELDRVDELLGRVEEREPAFSLLPVFRCWWHLAMAERRPQDAVRHRAQAVEAIVQGLVVWESSGRVPSFQLQAAWALAVDGRTAEARAMYDQIELERPDRPALADGGYASAVQQFKVRVGLAEAADREGDPARVREELSAGLELVSARAIPECDPWALGLGVDPGFAKLTRPESQKLECPEEWTRQGKALRRLLRDGGLRGW